MNAEKILTTDNLTIDDVMDWARSAANGTETDDELMVTASEEEYRHNGQDCGIDEGDLSVSIVGLKYDCETGDLYFAHRQGVDLVPAVVRNWIESEDAGEFAASL